MTGARPGLRRDAALPRAPGGGTGWDLARARGVAEAYEDVEVSTAVVRARDAGGGMVEAARGGGALGIGVHGAPIQTFVIPSDEERMIAWDTAACLRG